MGATEPLHKESSTRSARGLDGLGAAGGTGRGVYRLKHGLEQYRVQSQLLRDLCRDLCDKAGCLWLLGGIGGAGGGGMLFLWLGRVVVFERRSVAQDVVTSLVWF